MASIVPCPVEAGLVAWEPQVSDAFPHFVEGTCPRILWALHSLDLRLETHSYHFNLAPDTSFCLS